MRSLPSGGAVRWARARRDHDQYAEMNKHYAEFFRTDPPVRTTLGVAQVPGDSRLEITCVAYGDLAEKKRIGDPPAGFPYSPGILAGDTLYISGQADRRPDGSHPGTIAEQVRQCMRNVEAILKQYDGLMTEAASLVK